MDRAVEAARRALDGPWGRTPPNERSRLLHALADAIHANRKELAELESRNVGKAISSVKAEIGGAVESFRFFASVIGSIAGRSNPIGGSLPIRLLAEGARRRRRPDRAVELPAADGDVEACSHTRRRLLGRAEARSARRRSACSASQSSPEKSASRPERSTSFPETARRQAPISSSIPV